MKKIQKWEKRKHNNESFGEQRDALKKQEVVWDKMLERTNNLELMHKEHRAKSIQSKAKWSWFQQILVLMEKEGN
jgi:hypothetical protein